MLFALLFKPEPHFDMKKSKGKGISSGNCTVPNPHQIQGYHTALPMFQLQASTRVSETQASCPTPLFRMQVEARFTHW